ncbi:hypothetical protein BZARG_660 [Bizionia argentinensis JUB59]|uniref:Uncharacterized protein n=1 Tax=Bizionia argentinensis JUB59 TaxID=1046627 RepID=G2EAX8_9FLAO|nr:hypothetical protein [Bizionia argentinensis]EGV44352.1 hypothetical protein BZARG_660 [Bizionia argentinensis JUB59]
MKPETSSQNLATNFIVNINDSAPLTICNLDGTQDHLALFDFKEKDFEVLNCLGFVEYNICYYQIQLKIIFIITLFFK